MNQKELLAFAKEAAKSMKTEKDLGDFDRMLKKVTVLVLSYFSRMLKKVTVMSNVRSCHVERTILSCRA
jgi:hypothetical protein